MTRRHWASLACLAMLLAAVPALPAYAEAPATAVCGVARLAGTAAETATPVLLVHGIQSSADVWTGDASTSMSGRAGSIPGYAVFGFDYREDSLSWVEKPAIGQLLANTITCLALKSSRDVVVVAHSMGGLATRYAASQPDGAGGTVDQHIARVVTLGTPYTGAQVLGIPPGPAEIALNRAALADGTALTARLAMFWCGLRAGAFPREGTCGNLRVPDTEAGRALRPGSAELARLPAWPDGTVVHAMGGDLGRLSGRIFAYRPDLQPLGDGIVPVESALAGGTGPATFTDTCAKPGTVTIADVMTHRCSHQHLPADPVLIDRVVHLLRGDVIGAIDWRTGWFTTDCGGKADAPMRLFVRDGSGHAAADGAYTGGYDIGVETGATGDGIPEAAVLVSCTPLPSNFSTSEVQVFTGGGAHLAALPKLEPLPSGLRLSPVLDASEIAIKDGLLHTGVWYYASTDNHADGPSVHRTLTWEWDGERFVRTDAPASSAAPWAGAVGAWAGPFGSMTIHTNGAGTMTVASWRRCDDPATGVRTCDNDDVEIGFQVTSVTASQVRANVTASRSPLAGRELVFVRTTEPRDFLELDIGEPAVTQGSYYFCRLDDPRSDVECG